MMHRINTEQFLLSLIWIEQLSHIFLPDYHILSTVEEKYGQIYQIEIHHEISVKYIDTHLLLDLTLHEI